MLWMSIHTDEWFSSFIYWSKTRTNPEKVSILKNDLSLQNETSAPFCMVSNRQVMVHFACFLFQETNIRISMKSMPRCPFSFWKHVDIEKLAQYIVSWVQIDYFCFKQTCWCECIYSLKLFWFSSRLFYYLVFETFCVNSHKWEISTDASISFSIDHGLQRSTSRNI